jgi:transposase
MPEETARVAHAAFPKGNSYLRMRDALGPLDTNPEVVALFPKAGQPAAAPAHLALVTIRQFAAGLADRQAADAVRARRAWKDALARPLADPGFDASGLSEFRSRLITGRAEPLVFETLLTRFREQGLVKARGRPRTDSTHVLAALQVLNRLECVGETLPHALTTLATVAPTWLRTWVPSGWFDRYSRRCEEDRWPPGKAERSALAEQRGADGQHLRLGVSDPTAPFWRRAVPAVQTWRQVWVQQCHASELEEQVPWRTAEDLPPAALLSSSPSDPEARYSKTRTTEGSGDKVPLTEPCAEDTPPISTEVVTTPASTQAVTLTPTLHAHLAACTLTPQEDRVDARYVTAEHLVTSRTTDATEVVGPVGEDRRWPAPAGAGMTAAQLVSDWEAHRAVCPHGQTSVHGLLRSDGPTPEVQINFAPADCQSCPRRAHGPRSASGARWLTVPAPAHYEALPAARERQTTAAFKAQ